MQISSKYLKDVQNESKADQKLENCREELPKAEQSCSDISNFGRVWGLLVSSITIYGLGFEGEYFV